MEMTCRYTGVEIWWYYRQPFPWINFWLMPASLLIGTSDHVGMHERLMRSHFLSHCISHACGCASVCFVHQHVGANAFHTTHGWHVGPNSFDSPRVHAVRVLHADAALLVWQPPLDSDSFVRTWLLFTIYTYLHTGLDFNIQVTTFCASAVALYAMYDSCTIFGQQLVYW